LKEPVAGLRCATPAQAGPKGGKMGLIAAFGGGFGLKSPHEVSGIAMQSIKGKSADR